MTHPPSHTALAWREIGDGAPSETLVLVYGNAPVRFGYRDALGNWRAKHHGPLRTPPTHWMPLPPPPGTEPPQSITEMGWVIEHGRSEVSKPEYWTGNGWSTDNLEAIRFARKEDAERTAKGWDEDDWLPGDLPHRIAEHGWG